MKSRIFISSVQREFAKERKDIASYIRQDARCREWGLPDPQWKVEDGDDFVMVMPRPQSSVKTVDWTVDWTVDKTVDGSTNERILHLLATNPRATQEELARVLGLSVRGIEYAIGTLKKAKRIRKVGGKRFGHWEISE